MGTNYIAPIWRMPENKNNYPIDKLSNYSIEFSGSDYIEIADNILSGLEKFSISVWYNANSLPVSQNPTPANDRAILGAWSSGVTQMLLYWDDNTGWRFLMNDGTSTYAVTWGTAATANIWNHIAIIYDGSTISFYHNNGTPITNPGAGSVRTQTVPWRIGVDTSSTRYWDGKLSQFCLFDYALSTDQRNYIYNLNNPMAITGAEPIAYYPLGDNSNPNSPGSFPNISVGADSVFNFIPHDYIQVTDNDSLSFGNEVTDSPFTMSAWIKTTGNGDGIISKWGGSPLGYEWIFYIVANKIRVTLYDANTSNFQQRNGTTIINTGEWFHVLTTYDGRGGDGTNENTANQGIKIYINGAEESSYTNARAGNYVAMHNTIRPVQIGTYNTTSSVGFDGEMTNVQIWKSELTSAQVSKVYNNGSPLTTGAQPNESSLAAWYKLNQTANWEADTTGEWQIPDSTSAYPQSFDFDGSQAIDIPTLDLGVDGSISMWFKPITGGIADFVLLGEGSQGFDYVIRRQSGTFIVWIGSTFHQFTGFGSNVVIGDWNFLALTKSAGDVNLYLNNSNGKFLVSTTKTNWVSAPLKFDRIGGRTVTPVNLGFEGKISNFQAWDTTLSSTDITNVYNDGVPLTSAYLPGSHLKAWYKLDNTEFYDTFNTTNKWMINNNSFKNFDKCFWMNPLGIQVASTLGYQDGTNAFSGAAWVNISSGNPSIISRQRGRVSSTGRYPGWTFGTLGSGQAQGDPQFLLQTNTNGGIRVKSLSYTLQDGNWHFLAFTYDGSQDASGIKIYVDGYEDTNRQVLENNLTGTMSDYNTPFMIGGSYNSYLNNRYGTNQFMSNAMYFESELSASDILTLYNNGAPLNDLSSFTTVKGWWKLDDTATYGTGWTVPDASGNGNTGTSDTTMPITNRVDFIPAISNGVSSGMTEQNLVNNNVSALNGKSFGMDTTNLVTSDISRTQPYSNYSFNFDRAQADFFNVGTDSSLDVFSSGPFSCSIWFNYTDSAGDANPILEFPTFSQKFGMTLGLTLNTGVAFFYGPNANTTWRYNGGSGFNDGNWHNFIVTKDGSSLKGYVDGVELSFSTGSITAGTDNVIGAGRNIDRFFNGKLSNCCLFNKSLTEQEILKIYNNGITQDLQATSSFSNNVVAWWPMDERSSYYDGTDWVVRDLVNGNDGSGANTGNVIDLVGDAPGSKASGTGNNLAIADLKGNMYNSNKNAYSINMADYADGVTNPANSGRSIDTP